MKKSLIAAFAALFMSSAPVAAGPVQNEILFLMDMSGSLRAPSTHPDGNFAYWQQEINFVQSFVDQTYRADGGNAYGIVHYSGSSSANTVSQSAAAGRMNLVYGLNDPDTDPYTGSSVSGAQDKASLDAFIGGMGPADFEGGFSWTSVALGLAQAVFDASSNGDTNKYLFILTDALPATVGYEAADEFGYVSPELQALRAADVTIAVAGFNLSSSSFPFLDLVPSAPELVFDGADPQNDFTDFLPQVDVALPAPPAAAFLLLGVAALAVRRRRTGV